MAKLAYVRLKATLLHGCFSHFLNRTNGTIFRKASQIYVTSSDAFRLFFETPQSRTRMRLR